MQVMSPWAPLGQFLRFSCFDDWQFWVLPVSYFVECSSAGIHRKLFSWIGCGYSFLAEGLRKKCVIFIISKVYSTNRIYHYWGWPPSPVLCGICSFLHNKVPPLYPSHLSSTCSPHLGVGRYSPPPLLQSIYINYLKFLHWRFVSSLRFVHYSISYLYQYGLLDIYFIPFYSPQIASRN